MSSCFRLLNSSLPCLFSALQVALPSGTLVSWKKCGKWRISSNKQWNCDLFASSNNAHKPLRICVTRVRGSYHLITCVFGFLGARDSIKPVFPSLIGSIFLVEWTVKGKWNVLWKHWHSLMFIALKRSSNSYFRTIKYVDMIIFSNILAGWYV